MDLLGQDLNNKKQMPNSKKIVLISLILCIVLLILVLVALVLMQGNQTKPLSLIIDNNNVQINDNTIITNENGISYISLQQISESIGYEYVRGEYLQYGENDNKCYLENQNQIIGFETNSNEIYKTSSTSNTDYQYYELKNNIIKNNEILYIALEDLNVACNVLYSFSEQDNAITIKTIDNLSEYYKTQLTDNSMKYAIDENFNNQKVLSYGMIIVSNNVGKVGVVDVSYKTIISNRYTTMEFDEFSQNFIVSDENKYGIVSKDGSVLVDLRYEDIEIINYSPLLYKVKQNNKYGMLDEEGRVIINSEYDGLGLANYTSTTDLLIKGIDGNEQNGIIVYKDGKYGIIDIETGEIILDCTVDRIYYNEENDAYYVQAQNSEVSLEEYIRYANTTVVNLQNQ